MSLGYRKENVGAELHNVSDNTIQGMRTQTRRMLVTLGATGKNFLFVSLEKVDFYGRLFLRVISQSVLGNLWEFCTWPSVSRLI